MELMKMMPNWKTDDMSQQMYESDDDGMADSTLLYCSDSQASQGI